MVRANDSTGVGVIQNLSTVYDLAVGDYVDVRVYQTSGIALDVLLSPNYSPEFMMERVGA